MKVILNADDFGLSSDTTDAIVACLERGQLTNVSIMANMPDTERAIEFALEHPEYSYGVHLNFVGDGTERPVSDPASIPALVDGDGRLRRTREVRLGALKRRVPVEEIALEMDAQISAIAARGVPIAHVDSHRHLHKFAPFREALRQVLPRYGINRVRTVQDVYLRKPLASPTFYVGKLWRRDLVRSFVTTDHLYAPASAADIGWDDPLLSLMEGLPGSTIEVCVHPGVDEEWRRQERASLEAFVVKARERGHSLVAWRDLV
jgi:predicted glycoside hydrolase/deacetylase ChbG (UPF0249 family)